MYKLISNLDVFARVEYKKECKMMYIDKYNGAYLGIAISSINPRKKAFEMCV